jgi:hypothetical protein
MEHCQISRALWRNGLSPQRAGWPDIAPVTGIFTKACEGRRQDAGCSGELVMIPLAPVPFAALGTLCYGELYFGLCRALAAPWLDPWWVTRARPSDQGQALPPGEIAAPPSESPTPAAAVSTAGSTGAVIIPFDRSRAAHRAPSGRP